MPAQKTARVAYAMNVGVRLIAVVILLSSIAVISLLGTFPTEFVPQQVPGAGVANALIRLTRVFGGHALYQTPFFVFLLLCLAASLIEIVVWQLRPFFSRDKIRLRIGSAVNAEVRLETSFEKSHKKILSAGAALHYQPVVPDKDEAFKERIQLIKNSFGVWGPLGVHLGVLLVLLGGLVTFWTAEVKEVEVREGEALYLDHEKMNLTLDKFSVIPYPGKDQTQEYLSRFTSKDEKSQRQHLDLRVNHPLKVGLTKIFQMRYRVEVPRAEVLIYKDGKPLRSVMLEGRKEMKIQDTGLVLGYEKVLPDFRIDKAGNVFSVSPRFVNPAVKLSVNGQPRWIFGELLSKHRSSNDPWDFSIQKLHKVYYSGVRVSRDPGIPFAFFGFGVLVFATFFSSFAIPRVIGVTIRHEHDGQRILLEGLSPRDSAGLEEEIGLLAARLTVKG